MFNRPKKSKQSLGRVGRVEQEQRYNRIIRFSTYGVIGLVVLVTIIGVVMNTVVIPSRPIVSVNGEEIITRDFQKRVHIERNRLVNLYNQYLNQYTTYQQIGQTMTDPAQQQQVGLFLQQIEAQIQQIEFQLGSEELGEQVLNQMIDEIFIVEEAQARGITVTDEEVEDYFFSIFGYYPDGFPTPEPTDPITPTATWSATQRAMITPTPEPTLAEGEEATTDALAEAPLPTSVTEEEYENFREDYLAQLRPYGVDEAYLKGLIRIQILREKLNEELAAGITPPTQEEVWARHILIRPDETAEDQEAAKADALARAEELMAEIMEGGDFGDLAREFSDDTGSGAQGGDLGWFTRGMMVPPFEEAAFGAEVGELVGPVESQFGYHIIQVLGKEDRPADQSLYDNLVLTALTDILNQYKEEAEIVFLQDDWIRHMPTEPDVIRMAPQQ
jgi:parvulin-like peptidyl-prolyl isomerase